MMVRRIRVEPLELFGIIRRAVLRNPQLRNLKILVAQHVQQRYLAHHRSKQIGPLRQRGAHQQAAIRSALYREVLFISVLFGNEIFGGRNEVVENVLLLVQHSSAMPVFPELGPTAQVGNREYATVFEPYETIPAKIRHIADVESTVSGQ